MALIKVTRNDLGCWADGSLGHDHIRARLAWFLVINDCPDIRLIESLRGEMSDDALEENDALDWLNDNISADFECYFEMADGDLMLVENVEDEDNEEDDTRGMFPW